MISICPEALKIVNANWQYQATIRNDEQNKPKRKNMNKKHK